MRKPSKQTFLVALTAFTLAAAGGTALAQAAYPAKPIRVIVPYPAGGVLDQFARIVTEHIAKRWPQPFIVDARPGASTNIGTQAVKSSEPDGYTWLFTSGAALASNPTLFKNAGWDAGKDFAVVGNVSYAQSVPTV